MQGLTSSVPPILTATDNDTHSPETWAELISKLVFPISPTIAPEREAKAKDIQSRIMKSLVPLVEQIRDRERQLVVDDKRFAEPLDGSSIFLQEAQEIVFQHTVYTPWGDYLRKYREIVRFELKRQLDEIQHVERLWRADNHPESEAGRKYRRQYLGEN